MSNPNIEIAKRFYDYINQRSVENWDALFAAEWTALPAMPEAPNQVAGYKQVIDQFRAGAPDLVVENLEMIANEDVVAVRSKVSGTNTGSLFGQPATGKALVFTAMDIHKIVDGKIVATWHVEDFANMFAQLS